MLSNIITGYKWNFPFKVQKLSIDAGFTCPNRDGKISYGGCTFCDNSTFNPNYANSHKTISEQIQDGKMFFSGKYPEMKYLAYFQTYSNTYAPLDVLKQRYQEALSVEDIVGIIIGTRPDCVNEEILDYLAELGKDTFVCLEYGVESTKNITLQRINRGHNYERCLWAINETRKRNIHCGIHVILGLPGETDELMLSSADDVAQLPIDFLKIHQLQVIKGTKLENEYKKEEFETFTLEHYIELLAQYIRRLPPTLAIERFVSQSPAEMIVAPHWGIKNHEFTHKLIRYMEDHDYRQGQLYKGILR